MKSFKFLSKKQKPIANMWISLSPEDRNIYTKGYYDAFDSYTHGHDLVVPYDPLTQELKYQLWNEGVRLFEDNNNAE